MSYRLGVDLGTTWTAAATSDGGRSTMVGLGNRALQIPSVLFAPSDGPLLVGEAAERRALQEPSLAAREFKRRLGDDVPLLIGGQPYSPQALLAQLLRWVAQRTIERSGSPPRELAVTHPANWGPFKQDLLGQAITMADLDISEVSTLTEPAAAARQYASQARVPDGSPILVYDLGGGTFDVCVLVAEAGRFTVLGRPDGLEHLGGVDFDEAVFRHVLNRVTDEVPGLDLTDDQAVSGLARLRRECVEAKEALSNDSETVIPVSLRGVATTAVRLNRRELEQMIRPALQQTLDAIHRALRSANLTPDELAALVLVGGSSRIPLVSELLTAEFAAKIALDTHPKHDVALGAALSDSISPGVGTRTSTPTARKATPQREPVRTRESARKLSPPPLRWRLAAAAAGLASLITGVVVIQTREPPPEDALVPSATATLLPRSVEPLAANVLVWWREVDANMDVWAIRVDGADTKRLTRSAGADSRPVLSPDRRTIVYAHTDAEGTLAPGQPGPDDGLWVMGADGSDPRLLFPTGPARDLRLQRPAWSPDGRAIATVVTRPGRPQVLTVIGVDGAIIRELASADELGDPTWNVDGSIIAFWSSPHSDLDGGTLMTVPADGSSEASVFLPGRAGQDADPAWSPTGDRLAFRRRGATGHDIWVVNRDGTGLRQLTRVAGDDQDPSWSPNGNRIAFKSARKGEPDVYLIDLADLDQRLLLHNPGLDDAPSWTSR